MLFSHLLSALVEAWDLVIDRPLPKAWREYAAQGRAGMVPEWSYFALPELGMLWSVAAVLVAALIGHFATALGGAVLFAALFTIASEWRTTSRGMALTAGVTESMATGTSWRESMAGLKSQIRELSGPYASLSVIIFLAIKFFALMHLYRSGFPAWAGAALVLAFTVEGSLATLPGRPGGLPLIGSVAQPRWIWLVAGFWMLFFFVHAPFAALCALAAAALVSIVFGRERLEETGGIASDEITLAGYFTETAVLVLGILLIA